MKILLTGGFGNMGIRFIEKFHKKYDLIVFGTKNSIKNFNKKNYAFGPLKIEEGRIESKKIFSVIQKNKPEWSESDNRLWLQ